LRHINQHKKKLREERNIFVQTRGEGSMSSEEYWDEYNNESESSMDRYRDPKHNRRATACTREES
jgi:hypothetical protein